MAVVELELPTGYVTVLEAMKETGKRPEAILTWMRNRRPDALRKIGQTLVVTRSGLNEYKQSMRK